MDESAGPGADLQLSLGREPDAEIETFVKGRIRAFNDEHSPHHRRIRAEGAQPLNILLHDAADRTVGGLTASTFWDWLELDDFWLDEAYRRQGLGTVMLGLAEDEAVARGCRHAVVRTFSFQARGFYEKRGYRVVGTLEDFPPGEALYTMRKEIGHDGSS